MGRKFHGTSLLRHRDDDWLDERPRLSVPSGQPTAVVVWAPGTFNVLPPEERQRLADAAEAAGRPLRARLIVAGLLTPRGAFPEPFAYDPEDGDAA